MYNRNVDKWLLWTCNNTRPVRLEREEVRKFPQALAQAVQKGVKKNLNFVQNRMNLAIFHIFNKKRDPTYTFSSGHKISFTAPAIWRCECTGICKSDEMAYYSVYN